MAKAKRKSKKQPKSIKEVLTVMLRNVFVFNIGESKDNARFASRFIQDGALLAIWMLVAAAVHALNSSLEIPELYRGLFVTLEMVLVYGVAAMIVVKIVCDVTVFCVRYVAKSYGQVKPYVTAVPQSQSTQNNSIGVMGS